MLLETNNTKQVYYNNNIAAIKTPTPTHLADTADYYQPMKKKDSY